MLTFHGKVVEGGVNVRLGVGKMVDFLEWKNLHGDSLLTFGRLHLGYSKKYNRLFCRYCVGQIFSKVIPLSTVVALCCHKKSAVTLNPKPPYEICVHCTAIQCTALHCISLSRPPSTLTALTTSPLPTDPRNLWAITSHLLLSLLQSNHLFKGRHLKQKL